MQQNGRTESFETAVVENSKTSDQDIESNDSKERRRRSALDANYMKLARKKSKYFLIKTILIVSFVTILFTLPSLATRSIIMVRLLSKNSNLYAAQPLASVDPVVAAASSSSSSPSSSSSQTSQLVDGLASAVNTFASGNDQKRTSSPSLNILRNSVNTRARRRVIERYGLEEANNNNDNNDFSGELAPNPFSDSLVNNLDMLKRRRNFTAVHVTQHGGAPLKPDDDDDETSIVALDIKVASNETDELPAIPYEFETMDFDSYLAILSERLDLLLLTLSSHKFFIFLFQCHLIGFSKVRDFFFFF